MAVGVSSMSGCQCDVNVRARGRWYGPHQNDADLADGSAVARGAMTL